MLSAFMGKTVSTQIDLLSKDEACEEVTIGVRSDSAVEALVHVPGLHRSGEYFPVFKGGVQSFRMRNCGIRSVLVKGNGGTATIDGGITAR